MLILKPLLTHKLLLQISKRSCSKNPFSKTWNVISKDIPGIFGKKNKHVIYPEHADVVIIGGGFIGSAIAYWLKTRASDGLNVVVLEKDPTYKAAQTNISLGTITQHFSLPENIELAKFAAEFIRNSKRNLNVDIKYCPVGHLLLACEKYSDVLERNVILQHEHGVKSEILTVEDINKRYPWMNTQDINSGCLGIESEGYFDSWSLLKGMITKSQELGASYVNGEVVGFELELQRDVLMEGVEAGTYKKINRVIYKSPDGEEHKIKFAACILAAGDKSGEIAKLAKIGTAEGMLQIPLPVQRRDEKVYFIKDDAMKTNLNTPIITDTTGIWMRHDGLYSNLLCGHIPLPTADPLESSSEEFYTNIVKPSLIHRVPEYQQCQVLSSVIESYDYNTHDETGIIGPHPYHNNLYIAAGFGKLGCVHSPGIGRAVAEIIIDSSFTTIDLTRYTFDRLLTGETMVEFNVY